MSLTVNQTISVSLGTVYRLSQDNNSCTEVLHLDRPIKEITSLDDSICILTKSGLISVYKKIKGDNEMNLELFNTVKHTKLNIFTM